MNKLARTLALGATLGLTTGLFAQPPGGPRGPGHGGPGGPGGPGPGHGHPIVRVLDADKDGIISAAEIANASAAILTLDANGDGKITKDDAPVPPADAPQRPADAPERPADAPTPLEGARPHPNDPIMLALDANGDGELSAEEIKNAPASLKALDLNKDGQLTPDEYRPLPPEKPTTSG